MSLFGKKSKNNEAEAPAAAKSSGDLAKVLDESVWESVFEDLKANKHFIRKGSDGRNKYIGFLLDTSQFGGLAGKDAKKDESKGSIVEAIKTGRIKTYLRTEMLFDGCIVVIPDRDTIENMDEFNLFNNCDYIPCTIDSSGEIVTVTERGTMDEDDPERTVRFDLIKDLVRNNGDIEVLFSAPAEVMFNNGSSQEEDIPDDPDDFNTAVNRAPAPAPVQADPVEDIPDDYDNIEADDLPYDIDEDSLDSVPEQDEAADVINNTDAGDFISEDTGGVDEYNDITEDIVGDFATRTLYSADLGLEISTQAFDVQFMHNNAFVPFNENRGEGWLNEQLSNYSKDANTHLERLHSENLFRLREKFLRMLQRECNKIVTLVDDQDSSTHYGRMRAAIEANRDKNMADIDKAVSEKQDQLDDMWNRTLEMVAETAASEARKQHIERYGKQHERDMADLRLQEQDAITADYNEALALMHQDRRAEATKLLDLAVNNILDTLSKGYINIIESESREYEKYQSWMMEFIDNNRKDEKARIEALAEENRQVKKANEVRGEYIAKMKAMSEEFDMKRTVMQADIDRIHKDHESEMNAYKQDFMTKLENEREHSASLQKQVDDLFARYKDLEDRKDAECEARMQSLRDDCETKNRQMEHIIAASKKSNIMAIGLAVAVSIIMLVVGVLIGGSGKSSDTDTAGDASAVTAVSYRVIHDEETEESSETAAPESESETTAVSSEEDV